MSTTGHFITRKVAQLPTVQGYRVVFCAAASREAAEYRRDTEIRDGFPCEVLQVSEVDFQRALNGALNGFKAAPGLR